MSIIAVTLACMLMSFIWNILFWDRSYGISMPIFAAIVISLFLWLKRKSLHKAKLTLAIHLFLLAYLSICVFCYRNGLILYATIPTVFFGLGAVAFIGKEGYSFSNCVGVIESLFKTIFGSIFAAPNAIGEAFNKLTGTAKASRAAIKVFIGILISIPFIVVFTWFFVSADPIFEKQLRNFFDFIWQPDLFQRGAVIIFMWFLFCGYLARSEKKSSLKSYLNRTQSKQNYDGIIVFVFLLINNLLFLSFIIIQLKYLFGGAEVIKNTSLTYAEYAHKGFFEFWAIVILASIIIIYTNYTLREQKGRIRRMVEYAGVAMICQTLVIISSGLKRIFVYEEAYGYTYLRILVALFFLWVAGDFVLFTLKIIRRKSLSWVISNWLCLAFIFLVFVSTFSVDKFIARKNVDRHLKHGKKIDIDYLSYLSTDAYSEIKRLKMETKDEEIRKSAEETLLKLREKAKKNLQHWASWNLSLYQVEQ
ncbi:MAG: DUF4173 domain-containing protein [Phycisphaerae bacterium]|nr:DUF4173 domain-containing protein [Phycisphaerae bacterium]